jgi:type III restriction enzyme
VLGRGLRVPESLAGTKPEVTVFNHQRWAKAIRGLVDEVMELDVRLSAYPIPERKAYNFTIDQVIYKVTQKTEKISERRGPLSLPKSIALAPQARRAARRTGYQSIGGDGATREVETDVRYPVRPVSEVAERVRNKLKAIDVEQGTTYAKKATVKHLEDIIRKSLSTAGSKDAYVSEENEQTILQSFGPLVRRATRQRPRLTVEVDKIVPINTSELPVRSIAVTALRKDAGLSYDEISLREGKEQDLKRLAEIDEGHPYGSAAVQLIPNSYNFRTSTNIVLTSHRPERLFVKELMRAQNAKAVDGWVKSPDSGFYSIEYTYRKGEHQKQSSFNPDFFISVKKGKEVLVVETKMDGDDSAENKGKLKYAEMHFDLLNKKQKARKYHFYFLSPKDYDLFFQALRDGKYAGFQSGLHTLLKRNGNGKPAPKKSSPTKRHGSGAKSRS